MHCLQLLSLLLCSLCFYQVASQISPLNIVVLSKTAGYRHSGAIPSGIQMFRNLNVQYPTWNFTFTEDSAVLFTRKFDILIFHCTTGTIFTAEQRTLLQNYKAGIIGIHSASDTEYDNPFYGDHIIGTWFTYHPEMQQATVRIQDTEHYIMKNDVMRLNNNSTAWVKTDEWYNFRINIRDNPNLLDLKILTTVDETTYTGGAMPTEHPITWCHTMNTENRNRVFYTALGHPDDTYTDARFVTMIRNAIFWVSNKEQELFWKPPTPIPTPVLSAIIPKTSTKQNPTPISSKGVPQQPQSSSNKPIPPSTNNVISLSFLFAFVIVCIQIFFAL